MLHDELNNYSNKDVIPFHMPGHKRRGLTSFDPYKIDITEIPGFDDLHRASGLIDELQRGYAKLYGAEDAFLSVNGSTLGNLAAIFAACDRGDEIIIADGCHRSVYHAIELLELKTHVIKPEKTDAETSNYTNGYGGKLSGEVAGDSGRIGPKDLEEAFIRYPKSRLAVITSPTYEGMVSDIKELVRVAHIHGAAIHIDGAHGAHHGLGGIWPDSIISSGADTAVLSLHKTLPTFTGSAIILRSPGSRIPRESLLHYIDCFETSSPSYILMYGMSYCLSFLKKGGSELFDEYANRLMSFYKSVEDLCHIRVDSDPHRDPSKIVIRGMGYLSGEEIAERLRNDHGIETELSSADHCLALSSVMDEDGDFERLRDALFAIDSKIIVV